MLPQICSRLINGFTAYPEVCELLKQLAELWISSGRWAVESPRVIEIPKKSLNHQLEAQSEAPDVEMQDIDYTHTSNINPHSSEIIQSFEKLDNPGQAENNFSDSEIQFHRQLSDGALISNSFEALEIAPRIPLDGVPGLEINGPSHSTENRASVEIDSYAFGFADPLLAAVPPSPSFTSVFTMELPSPLVLPGEYMNLTWELFGSSERQEDPIPELETLLDSSSWEDSWDMPQLAQNPDPPFELVDEGITSPPPAGLQKRLQ